MLVMSAKQSITFTAEILIRALYIIINVNMSHVKVS